MAIASYTLLQVLNIVGFRAGDVPELVTLMNPDRPTSALIEAANEVLRLLARVKPTMDLQARSTITTVAPYTTGTVYVTQQSNQVSGVNTNWTSVLEGRYITITGSTSVHKITKIVDATNLEMDPVYPGDTITTPGVAYTIAQDRYALPSNFYDFIDVTVDGPSGGTVGLRRISEVDAYRAVHSPPYTGIPRWASQIQESTGRFILLDPYPDKIYTLAVRHRIMPARLQVDGDIVPVADEDISILLSGILANWLSITKPEAASAYESWKYSTLSLAMAQDQRTTDEVVRVVPDDVMRSPNEYLSYGKIDWKDR